MADCSDQAEFEQLPDLYQRWVEALLPEGIPREGQATCFNCTMCHKGDAAPDEGVGFFNPVTKCCTYFPDVPNFLVGRAIAVDTPGAAALRAFVDSGSGTRTNVPGASNNSLRYLRVWPTPLWAGVATMTLGQKTMVSAFSSFQLLETALSR